MMATLAPRQSESDRDEAASDYGGIWDLPITKLPEGSRGRFTLNLLAIALAGPEFVEAMATLSGRAPSAGSGRHG